MLIIAIEDFKLCLNNKNLLLEKSAIWFELYTKKSEKDKYLILFFYYNSQILIDVGVYT